MHNFNIPESKCGERAKAHKGEEGEVDFIIISKNKRHIYVIESKYGSTKSVIAQLNKIQEFLEKKLGNIIKRENNWKFFKCVHFHEMTEKVNKQICPQCKPFCITKDWSSEDFQNLIMQNAKVHPEPSGEVFQNLAKYLLLMQQWNKEPVTKAAMADKQHKVIQEKVGSAKNILLWTRDQLSALRLS